jgi:hypothetical protein
VTCLNIRLLAALPLLSCGLAFGQNGALRIVEPAAKKGDTVVTNEPAITLRGTLAWTGGDMRVLWKNFRGFSDLATATVSEDGHTVLWKTNTPIPLRPGVNHLRIQALGQPGAVDFLNIYYPAPVTTPPQVGTTILHGKQIVYEVKNGRAVYQSDMILGEEAEAANGRFAGRLPNSGCGRSRRPSNPISNTRRAYGRW